MMKLVVLCLVFAAVRAEPGALLAAPLVAPLAYSAAVVAPATTTISQQSSQVVHPSPYYYNAQYFPHYIKKRSVGFALPAAYSTPLLGYPYSAPLLSTAYAAPVAALPATPIVAPAPLAYSHFIKKREAPLLAPRRYIAPALLTQRASIDVTHTRPVFKSYPAPAPYSPAPYSPAPYSYPSFGFPEFGFPHFIKKRSAPLLATAAYIAPAATSYQTRADVRTSAPLITSYASPFLYSSPFAPISRIY